MEILDFLIIIFTGMVAGFFNTVAGGGSLLSLPVLIFLGVPPTIANATNRVAIFSQNIFAVAGFRSKGVSEFPYSLWLGLSALGGAVLGAKIAVEIDGELFNRILAVVMVLVVLATVFKVSKGNQKQEDLGKEKKIVGIFTFFFVGIYGGFIQAGVGFLIIAALTNIHNLTLVKTNAIKVFVVFTYTIAALVVFIMEDQIWWVYGISLAAGNSAGAWFASRWSVKKGDKTLSKILIVMVLVLAVKLWFF